MTIRATRLSSLLRDLVTDQQLPNSKSSISVSFSLYAKSEDFFKIVRKSNALHGRLLSRCSRMCCMILWLFCNVQSTLFTFRWAFNTDNDALFSASTCRNLHDGTCNWKSNSIVISRATRLQSASISGRFSVFSLLVAKWSDRISAWAGLCAAYKTLFGVSWDLTSVDIVLN